MNLLRSFVISTVMLIGVSAVSAATPEPFVPVKTIALLGVAGKLDHLAVDSKGGRLFVANKPNNTLDIVDLKTGKLIQQVPGQGKISGVAFASDLNMIYVGNGAGTCNGFDGRDYRLVFTTPAAGADNVNYHSGNKMVYVGCDELLLELDGKTGELKNSVKLPGAVHGFKIDKKAGKIFCVLTKPSMVAVVDLATHEVTNKFPLTLADGPSPIAQDAANGLIFVGCRNKPAVVVLEASTGKELTSIEIAGGIDDLHFDSKRNRLYASCADKMLVVIEKTGDKFEVIAKLETPKDSRTCVWSSGKLYLGVPKQDGQNGPEVRIFEAMPIIEAKPTAAAVPAK